MLADPARPHKDAAFSLVTRGPQRFGRTVTTTRWRFTQWSDGATALYDPDADPEETCNASADAANAPVVAELRQKPVSLPPCPAPAGK